MSMSSVLQDGHYNISELNAIASVQKFAAWVHLSRLRVKCGLGSLLQVAWVHLSTSLWMICLPAPHNMKHILSLVPH
jgi:hypothetical protein